MSYTVEIDNADPTIYESAMGGFHYRCVIERHHADGVDVYTFHDCDADGNLVDADGRRLDGSSPVEPESPTSESPTSESLT